MTEKRPKFKTMKVFDCQSMPKDVRREFFNQYDNKCNDCYVDFYLEETDDNCIVKKWLIDNGADANEEVIVSHWW